MTILCDLGDHSPLTQPVQFSLLCLVSFSQHSTCLAASFNYVSSLLTGYKGALSFWALLNGTFHSEAAPNCTSGVSHTNKEEALSVANGERGNSETRYAKSDNTLRNQRPVLPADVQLKHHPTAHCMHV